MKKLTLTALLALTIVAQPVYAETSTNPNVAHEVATESHHSEDKPEREQSSQEIKGFIGKVVRGAIDKVGDMIGRAEKASDKAEKASNRAEKASNRAEKASDKAEKASDKAEKGNGLNGLKEWTKERIKNGVAETAVGYGTYRTIETIEEKIQEPKQTNEDHTRCLQCSER